MFSRQRCHECVRKGCAVAVVRACEKDAKWSASSSGAVDAINACEKGAKSSACSSGCSAAAAVAAQPCYNDSAAVSSCDKDAKWSASSSGAVAAIDACEKGA